MMERVDYQSLIIQDLVNWEQRDELKLNPWYQRRSVWSKPQKSYLLNTLFEQKPVPTLYFRHIVDLERDRSIREVVDGQQRIRAILEYISGGFSAYHPLHKTKVLYDQLTLNQKRSFRETMLSGGWLLGATEADVIEVFGRLNSVAKTLNQQEKRNAKFSGEFKQFCLREAASRISLWRDLGVFSANDIARMQEVEFVSDVILNMIEGLSDFDIKKLQRIYADNDEDFTEATAIKKRLDSVFSRIVSISKSSIRDTIFSRRPVFFSLVLVLDSKPNYKGKKLEEALNEIDERFNSDKPPSERPKEDSDFYNACIASTQRIANRKVRSQYIESFLE